MNRKNKASLAAAAVLFIGSTLSGCAFGGKTIERNEETSALTTTTSLAAPVEIELSAETPLDSSSAEKPDVVTPLPDDSSNESSGKKKKEIETKLPDQIVTDPGVPTQSKTTQAPSLDAGDNAPGSPSSEAAGAGAGTAETTKATIYTSATSSISIKTPEETTTKATVTTVTTNKPIQITLDDSSSAAELPSGDSDTSSADDGSDGSDDFVYDDGSSESPDSSSNVETIIDHDDSKGSDDDSEWEEKEIELPPLPVY